MPVPGEPDNGFDRIELVEYRRAVGNDRYPDPMAPALGTLHVVYSVNDTDQLQPQAEEFNDEMVPLALIDSQTPKMKIIQITTPAGLRFGHGCYRF